MSNKTKILYGIESVGGGSLKHLVYLACNLPKESFDVTVVYSDNREKSISNELTMLLENDVKLIHHSMSRTINLYKDIKSILFLSKLIKKENYDVVHSHSSKAGLIFRVSAYIYKVKKIYYTPHCFYFQSKKGIIKSISLFYEKLMLLVTTKIIVSNGEYTEALNNGLDASKFEVINNAIQFNDLSKKEQNKLLKKQFNIPENINFIVGAIGRIVPQKNLETYIYAANEVLKIKSSVMFLVVGCGKEQNKIIQLVKDLGIQSNVVILGHVKEVKKIYNLIDVLVSTSLWEGLPYVFLEAMFHEKPIIATSYTGVKDSICENIILCPQKDYERISSNIISLMEDSNKRISLGKKGKKMLSIKLPFKQFIERHYSLYNS